MKALFSLNEMTKAHSSIVKSLLSCLFHCISLFSLPSVGYAELSNSM